MKFLFLHLPKTGGTSINNALRGQDLLVFFGKGKHFPASRVPNKFLKNPKVKFLTSIRNPYDQLHSHFLFTRIPRKIVNTKSKKHPWHGVNTLEDFVFAFKKHKNKQPYVLLPENQLYLNGRFLPDHVFRFESLEEDFNNFCSIYNLDITLPHSNKNTIKPDTIDKTQLYTPEMRDIVEDLFKVQFQLGDYSYEEWLNS